jgi:hypothetical protein
MGHTVASVGIEKFLDNKEFMVPSTLLPPIGCFFPLFPWTAWNILQTPAAVIPNPVDFGMTL